MGLGQVGSHRDSSYDSDRFHRFHGCEVRIFKNYCDVVEHERRFQGGRDIPAVRSYSDGIKVGCTFITNEALKRIYDWQQEFLTDKTERTWQ